MSYGTEEEGRDRHTIGRQDTQFNLEGALGFVRLAAIGFGGIVALIGLMLSLSVFGLVKDIMSQPETIDTYLDQWEGSLFPEREAARRASAAVDATVKPVAAGVVEDAAQTDGEATPRQRQPRGAEKFFSTLADVLHDLGEGNIARPLGAFFILAFAGLLIRIPILLLAEGNRMLLALINRKPKEGKPK